MKLVQSINYKLYAESDILINTRLHSFFFVSSPCDELVKGRVRCPNLDFIQLESFLWRLAFISHVTQQKNTIVLPINPSYHDQTLLELEVLETKHWPVTMLTFPTAVRPQVQFLQWLCQPLLASHSWPVSHGGPGLPQPPRRSGGHPWTLACSLSLISFKQWEPGVLPEKSAEAQFSVNSFSVCELWWEASCWTEQNSCWGWDGSVLRCEVWAIRNSSGKLSNKTNVLI